MDKVIRCRDVGFDCEGVIRAMSMEEAVAQAAAHALSAHGLIGISDEVIATVRAAVRDA